MNSGVSASTELAESYVPPATPTFDAPRQPPKKKSKLQRLENAKNITALAAITAAGAAAANAVVVPVGTGADLLSTPTTASVLAQAHMKATPISASEVVRVEGPTILKCPKCEKTYKIAKWLDHHLEKEHSEPATPPEGRATDVADTGADAAVTDLKSVSKPGEVDPDATEDDSGDESDRSSSGDDCEARAPPLQPTGAKEYTCHGCST